MKPVGGSAAKPPSRQSRPTPPKLAAPRGGRQILLQIFLQEPRETHCRSCQLLFYHLDALLIVAWVDFKDLRLATPFVGLAVADKNKVRLYGLFINNPRVDR